MRSSELSVTSAVAAAFDSVAVGVVMAAEQREAILESLHVVHATEQRELVLILHVLHATSANERPVTPGEVNIGVRDRERFSNISHCHCKAA